MRPCTRPDCPDRAWFDEGGPALCRTHLTATGRDLPPPLVEGRIDAPEMWVAATWTPGDPSLLPLVPDSAYDDNATPLDVGIVATQGCQEIEGS